MASQTAAEKLIQRPLYSESASHLFKSQIHTDTFRSIRSPRRATVYSAVEDSIRRSSLDTRTGATYAELAVT